MDWKGLQIYIFCKVLKLYNSKCFCCVIMLIYNLEINYLSIYLSIANNYIKLAYIYLFYYFSKLFQMVKYATAADLSMRGWHCLYQ